MIEEGRLRAYLSALGVVRKVKCGCEAGGHAMECKIGGMIMRGQEDLLRWILGMDTSYDEFIRDVIDQAIDIQNKQNGW